MIKHTKKVMQLKDGILRNSNRDFRAAVLLCGNGVYDGTETTEAVSLLVALGKHKAQV